MTAPTTRHVTVAVIGGGPSGLTAAAALAPQVDGEVLVIDRESQMGGIPRHSDHPGYGMRDLRRFMSGPAYARVLTDAAKASGATLLTRAMVTGWAGDRAIEITSPQGREVVTADAIILATGARERPRAARRIPGGRPEGVYTTGQLQNHVHLHHEQVGTKAVVVGAELVSWSAVMTLREAGCQTVALVSRYPRSESYTAFRVGGRLAFRAPVIPSSRVVRIDGHRRVEGVVVEDLTTGRRRTLSCDTVVTTGDWVPDNELVRKAGIHLDPATLGPTVDGRLATSQPGVFAVGNLVHPVDTADGAALDGRHVADAVLAWLSSSEATPAPQSAVTLQVTSPFRWVTPQRLRTSGEAPRGHLLMWTDEYCRFPTVTAVQDGVEIGSIRTLWPAAPGRIFRVPDTLLRWARPDRGPVTIGLRR